MLITELVKCMFRGHKTNAPLEQQLTTTGCASHGLMYFAKNQVDLRIPSKQSSLCTACRHPVHLRAKARVDYRTVVMYSEDQNVQLISMFGNICQIRARIVSEPKFLCFLPEPQDIKALHSALCQAQPYRVVSQIEYIDYR
jgi:hypothetical protein